MSRLAYILIVSAFLVAFTCGAQIGEESPWDYRGPLDSMAAAARIYQDFPSIEIMPASELEPLLEEWDKIVSTDDVRGKNDLLRRVDGHVPPGYRLGGCWVLRYGNPEIEERVIDLYLDERARHYAGDSYSIPYPEDGSCADLVPDYRDHLAGLAYSTFSPEIYYEALDAYRPGPRTLLHAYLASVHPETTLSLLLETVRGQRADEQLVEDVLYHPNPRFCFGSLTNGFQLLVSICERSPEVILAKRDRVLDFVREHAKHYVKPIKPSYRPEPVYRWVLDYRMRRLALRTLEQFAHAEGVYSIVRDIMHDPPKNPSAASANEIIKLGERIIEQIEALR